MELKRLTEHIWYLCVEGHWVPVKTEDTLSDLMSSGINMI